MAIVHESSATAASGTFSKPAGAAVGDVLVASTITLSSSPTLTGWTQIVQANIAGIIFLTSWYRIVDGSEGASFTVGGGGTTYRSGCSRFSGVDTASPTEGTPTGGWTGSSSTHATASVTTATADAVLVNVGGAWHTEAHTVTGIGFAGSMTERWDTVGGTAAALGLATETITVPGATGTRTVTITISGGTGRYTGGLLFALKPASAGGVTVTPSLLSGDTNTHLSPVTVTTGSRSIITALPSVTNGSILAPTVFERVHVTVSAPLAGNDTYGVLAPMVVGGVTIAAPLVTGETVDVLPIGSVGVGVTVIPDLLAGDYADLLPPDILTGVVVIAPMAGSTTVAVLPATVGELLARRAFTGSVRRADGMPAPRGVGTDHNGPRSRRLPESPRIRGTHT